jgi:orotate phosphoribosyltransferase
MTPDEVLDEFRAVDALREGHFVLSSGLHSPVFLQKNLVFMHPERSERLCRALAERIRAEVGAVDAVVSPAVGGIIPGYETARHLAPRPCIWSARREASAFAAASASRPELGWSWWRTSSPRA